MTTHEIERFVRSKNPKQKGTSCLQLQYGEEIGGTITHDVRLIGEVYIPITSWCSGKMKLKNVKLPQNINIISLSIHDKHENVSKIGDFELVHDFRIARGIYCSGLIRKEDHDYLNARIIIGYELFIYSRLDLTKKNYKKTQKEKKVPERWWLHEFDE